MHIFKKIYQCCFLLLVAAAAAAQNIDVSSTAANRLTATKDSAEKIIIRQIIITGNSKTKAYIIRREIQIKTGDSVKVADLNGELQKVRQQVYNTNLFLEVNVDIATAGANQVDVLIAVKERWYIFPIPKFQLIDRNINEWLQKYDGDLLRVVYGIKFTHYNLSGRRDLLRLTFLNGFTRNISFTYFRPVSEKSLNNGFSFTGGYLENREFIYKIADDNKPLLFNNGSFSRKNIFAGVGYNFRKNIMGTHFFNMVYNHVSVSDSLVDPLYNPNYFKERAVAKNYIDLSYTYQYINTNNAVYPLKGVTASVKVLKRGFGFSGGVNMFSVEGSYNNYWSLKKDWYASLQLSGKTTLPFDQPYINQRALGYNDINLRGLELYVVDGVAYGLVRSTLKKKLFTINIPTPFKKSEKYRVIPFTVFAKTYTDFGVTYTKPIYQTSLSNKLLYTGGFGIDILTIYDINLRIEYSFNQLGKNGLFLQAQSGL